MVLICSLSACSSESSDDSKVSKEAEAEKENVEIKVKEISLAGKEEYTETADVTYLKGEQEEKATLLFTHNSDGLVTKVEPAG